MKIEIGKIFPYQWEDLAGKKNIGYEGEIWLDGELRGLLAITNEEWGGSFDAYDEMTEEEQQELFAASKRLYEEIQKQENPGVWVRKRNVQEILKATLRELNKIEDVWTANDFPAGEENPREGYRKLMTDVAYAATELTAHCLTLIRESYEEN